MADSRSAVFRSEGAKSTGAQAGTAQEASDHKGTPVEDLFRGKSMGKLDGKGRVSLPATFRRALEANDPDRPEGEGALLFISHYYAEPFLTCMSNRGMQEMTRLVRRMHPGDLKRKALEEFIYENVLELRLDPTGRFVLPKMLRDFAGLTEEVIFGGLGDTFRIYSPEVPPSAVSVLRQEMSKLPTGHSPFALLPHAPAEADE